MAQRTPLAGLEKWVDRDEWVEDFEDTFLDHVEAACQNAKIDPADLRDLIGDFLYGVIWDAAFEDFLTRDGDEGDNITDDYLKRRGWKESPGNRAYLEALRDAPMSVYRVESVVPGKSVTLVDRLRDQDPVEVHDVAFSRQFDPGAMVAARVFEVRGRWRTGSVGLDFDEPWLEVLRDRLETLETVARTQGEALLAEEGGEQDPELIEALTESDILLAGAGFLFTDVWLRRAIAKLSKAALARFVTAEGEPLGTANAFYPFAQGVTAEALRARLQAVDALREQDDDEWTIVDCDAAPLPALTREPEAPRILDLRDDDGAAVLGAVTLADDGVVLATSAPSYLARARKILEAAVGELLGEPEIERSGLDEPAS